MSTETALYKCGGYQRSVHWLSADGFYKHSSQPSGLQKQCKACNKAYRQANADRIKERQKAYAQRNAERISEYQKTYRLANAEQLKARKKTYYQANAEQFGEWRKAYYQANAEQIKERSALYQKANPERHKERQKAYDQRNATPCIDCGTPCYAISDRCKSCASVRLPGATNMTTLSRSEGKRWSPSGLYLRVVWLPIERTHVVKVGIGTEKRANTGNGCIAYVPLPTALAYLYERAILAHCDNQPVPKETWPEQGGRTEVITDEATAMEFIEHARSIDPLDWDTSGIYIEELFLDDYGLAA